MARSPRVWMRANRSRLRFSLSFTKRVEIRIVRIRLRHEIEQVESAAGCSGQIGRDGRDDASRRTSDNEDTVLVEHHAWLSIGSGLFVRGRRSSAGLLGVSDLDRSRIVQSFGDQKFGDFACIAIRFKVDCLHQGFDAFTLVRLGKTRYGTAERSHCSERRHIRDVRRVASQTTRNVPGRPTCSYKARIVVYSDFTRTRTAFVPGSEVQFAKVAFVVERGQPEDSVRLGPVAVQVLRMPVRASASGVPSMQSTSTPSSRRRFVSASANAALVGHEYDTAIAIELHAGRFADGERRTQGRYRHASWNTVCRIEAGEDGAHSWIETEAAGPLVSLFLLGWLDARHRGPRPARTDRART